MRCWVIAMTLTSWIAVFSFLGVVEASKHHEVVPSSLDTGRGPSSARIEDKDLHNSAPLQLGGRSSASDDSIEPPPVRTIATDAVAAEIAVKKSSDEPPIDSSSGGSSTSGRGAPGGAPGEEKKDSTITHTYAVGRADRTGPRTEDVVAAAAGNTGSATSDGGDHHVLEDGGGKQVVPHPRSGSSSITEAASSSPSATTPIISRVRQEQERRSSDGEPPPHAHQALAEHIEAGDPTSAGKSSKSSKSSSEKLKLNADLTGDEAKHLSGDDVIVEVERHSWDAVFRMFLERLALILAIATLLAPLSVVNRMHNNLVRRGEDRRGCQKLHTPVHTSICPLIFSISGPKMIWVPQSRKSMDKLACPV